MHARGTVSSIMFHAGLARVGTFKNSFKGGVHVIKEFFSNKVFQGILGVPRNSEEFRNSRGIPEI